MFSSRRFGGILDGDLVLGRLEANETRIIRNDQVTQSDLKKDGDAPGYQAFEDEVLRTGLLPADKYYFRFELWSGLSDWNRRVDMIDDSQPWEIEIRNPNAPILISPVHEDESVGRFPTFVWEQTDIRPGVSVTYFLRLYEQFDREGVEISPEDAVSRIPIWIKEVINLKTVNFVSGEAREDFICGRKYVWQIQAIDEVGRYVGQNEGKSEIWSFTVQ